MPSPPWTTPDQAEFLESKLPEFLAAQRNKSTQDFWKTTYRNFFEKWTDPEDEIPALTVPKKRKRQAQDHPPLSASLSHTEWVQLRKNQINNWYNNRGAGASHRRRAPAVIIGNAAQPQRVLSEINVYSKKYYNTRVRERVAEAWKASGAMDKRSRIVIINKCLSQCWQEESDEIKTEIRQEYERLKALKDQPQATETSDSTAKTAESFTDALVLMPETVRDFLQQMSLRTGYTFTLIAGGPDAQRPGRMRVLGFHEGIDRFGQKFGAAYASFQPNVLEPFQKFLYNVYHIGHSPSVVTDDTAAPNTSNPSQNPQITGNAPSLPEMDTAETELKEQPLLVSVPSTQVNQLPSVSVPSIQVAPNQPPSVSVPSTGVAPNQPQPLSVSVPSTQVDPDLSATATGAETGSSNLYYTFPSPAPESSQAQNYFDPTKVVFNPLSSESAIANPSVATCSASSSSSATVNIPTKDPFAFTYEELQMVLNPNWNPYEVIEETESPNLNTPAPPSESSSTTPHLEGQITPSAPTTPLIEPNPVISGQMLSIPVPGSISEKSAVMTGTTDHNPSATDLDLRPSVAPGAVQETDIPLAIPELAKVPLSIPVLPAQTPNIPPSVPTSPPSVALVEEIDIPLVIPVLPDLMPNTPPTVPISPPRTSLTAPDILSTVSSPLPPQTSAASAASSSAIPVVAAAAATISPDSPMETAPPPSNSTGGISNVEPISTGEERSSRIRKPPVSKELQPSAWLDSAYVYLTKDIDDEKWKACIDKWFEFENEILNTMDTNSRRIPAKYRPPLLSRWVATRNYGTIPKVDNEEAFVLEWLQWWNEMQPKWRKSPVPHGLPLPLVAGNSKDDLSTIKKGGPTGLVVVLIGLKWWASRRAVDGVWHSAVADVMGCLLSTGTVPAGKKRRGS